MTLHEIPGLPRRVYDAHDRRTRRYRRRVAIVVTLVTAAVLWLFVLPRLKADRAATFERRSDRCRELCEDRHTETRRWHVGSTGGGGQLVICTCADGTQGAIP